MATISADTNINAVSYASGETLTINSGAVLTIDAQNASDVTKLATLPGTIQCITSGKLKIINNSTTTPLVVTLSANSKDFQFEKNGIFECIGDAIEIGTGNGSTQTFSFSASPLNTIPYPSYVEVETASGSGVYIPWVVIPTAGYTVTQLQTDFGALDDGMVLFWDGSTRQLTCGDNTNGKSIVSGAKVRIPNIYLHSNSNNATPSSRTLIDSTLTGRLYWSWVSCSNAIHYANSGPGEAVLQHCGFCGQFSHTSTNSNLTIDGLALCPDTEQTATAVVFSISGINGDLSAQNISSYTSGLVTGASKNIISACLSVVLLENLWFARKPGRSATTDEVLVLTFLLPKVGGIVQIDNLTIVGSRLEITNASNLIITNLKHCAEHGTTQQTALADILIAFSNAQNIKIVGLSNAGVTAPRSQLFNADGLSNSVQIFNANYNGNNASLGIIEPGNGTALEVYNSTFSNFRTGSIIVNAPSTSLMSANKVLNCRLSLASGSATNEGSKSNEYDLLPCTGSGVSTTMAGSVSYAFSNQVDLGLSPTTGNVVCGPFGEYTGLIFSGVTTGIQYDQAGGIEIPTNGNVIEVESSFIMHGVTSFQNASPGFSYTEVGILSSNTTTAPTSLSFEFVVKTPTGSYGSYQALSGANLNAALSALTGYDSDDGFYMKIKITATTDDSTRIINKIYMPTNIDNTYVAPDASLTIRGIEATDYVDMKLFSDDSTLFTFTGPGSHRFSASNYFQQSVYYIRYNSGGTPIMRTQATPIELNLGDNGNVNLFAGAEVQLAESSDVAAIKAVVDLYLDAAISSRATNLGTSLETLDNQDIEVGFSLRQILRLIAAATSGILSGAGTSTITIRDINDTKDRIVATVDSNGNRTSITKDVT